MKQPRLTLDTYKKALQFTALLQLALEDIDDLQGTLFYRQSLKNKMNALEREIMAVINKPVNAIDRDDESQEVLNNIMRSIDLIRGMTLEELAGLRNDVDEHRSNNKEQ